MMQRKTQKRISSRRGRMDWFGGQCRRGKNKRQSTLERSDMMLPTLQKMVHVMT